MFLLLFSGKSSDSSRILTIVLIIKDPMMNQLNLCGEWLPELRPRHRWKGIGEHDIHESPTNQLTLDEIIRILEPDNAKLTTNSIPHPHHFVMSLMS